MDFCSRKCQKPFFFTNIRASGIIYAFVFLFTSLSLYANVSFPHAHFSQKKKVTLQESLLFSRIFPKSSEGCFTAKQQALLRALMTFLLVS